MATGEGFTLMRMRYQEVIDFWFGELSPKDWFRKSDELDDTIRQRFGAVHRAACAAELADWRDTIHGRLAEVIVLDQFSRNLHRGDARSFAADPLALALSQEAIRTGEDQALEMTERAFLYMPFMHSESPAIHEQALKLFESCPPHNLDYERQHKAIIDRFGRYPHRNQILGRESTEEELAFLAGPNSSF